MTFYLWTLRYNAEEQVKLEIFVLSWLNFLNTCSDQYKILFGVKSLFALKWEQMSEEKTKTFAMNMSF